MRAIAIILKMSIVFMMAAQWLWLFLLAKMYSEISIDGNSSAYIFIAVAVVVIAVKELIVMPLERRVLMNLAVTGIIGLVVAFNGDRLFSGG